MNANIFKAYDIRGKYPADLNEKVAELVGKAIASLFIKKYHKSNPLVLVGKDVRNTSEVLEKALIKGLVSQGADVLRVGLCTTPYLYFLMNKIKPDGGVAVTASHNPKEYGGFKIRGKGNESVDERTGLLDIKKMVLSGEFKKSVSIGKIKDCQDFKKEYIKFLSSSINIKKNISLVVDNGGGSTALFLPELLSKFPKLKYKPLFFKIDGSFTKHSPNPLLAESQQFAKKELAKGGANFGIIFDGDGDRVIFLDEKGEMIKTEFILGLYAEKQTEKGIKTSVVMPVNTSRGVREHLEKSGVKVHLIRVGYTFVQQALKKSEISLGAEISGHLYFKDFFNIDSGLRALLKLSAIVAEAKEPLSRLVSKFETYINSGEMNFEVADKKKVLAAVKRKYKDAKISTLDGVTVEYPDWWFNVRPSNTEPLIRVVMEARDKKTLEEKNKELVETIKKYL
ncbi:MAG: phosphomannomutase/phosphoglucomutase [bacterium]|nr:phosphomannomutase/phosphoglucomutase [bacterium]